MHLKADALVSVYMYFRHRFIRMCAFCILNSVQESRYLIMYRAQTQGPIDGDGLGD